MADFYKSYLEDVRPALMKEFGYSNIMQAPKIEKIVVNIGVGRESNETYKETLNGVQLGLKKHQFKVPVDQYVKPDMPPLYYALCGCEDLPGFPEKWGGK